MKKSLKINKGVIIPLDLFNLPNIKLRLNELLSLSIIIHFNNDYFSTNIERVGKNPLPSYFINKDDIFKLIPLDKRTIKKSINNLIDLKLLNYYSYSGDITNLIKYKQDYKVRGFIFIPVEILYNKNLNTIEKFILSYIKGFNHEYRNYKKFTSRYLSSLFNVSERMINKTLLKLKNLELLQSDRVGRHRNLIINQINVNNYFKNADIREIKQAKIEKARIEKANINTINTVNTINTINIISLEQLTNINLTEEQKQYLREKLNL